MKTSVFTISFFLILCTLYSVLCTSSVQAQDFTAEKAYSDYQYQLSIYQQDYSDYSDAKTFYLSNSTLQLKESARQSTLKMLKDRDQLMIVYLTAIRMQIVESTGFNGDQKNAIYAKIDPEIAWYKDHITKYSNGDDLTTLFNKSDESKTRNDSNTKSVVYESLFDIGLSQEIGLRVSHQQIYTDLKNYINDQVSAGKLRIDPFNRWLNDTDAVLTKLQSNESLATTKIQKINESSYNVSSGYDSSVQILAGSINLLTQLNSYLTEMLASIQNQSQ